MELSRAVSQNLSSFTVPSSDRFSHLLKEEKQIKARTATKTRLENSPKCSLFLLGGKYLPCVAFQEITANLFFILDLLRDVSLVSGIHSSLDQLLSSSDNHHITGVVSIKPWNLTLWIECLSHPKLRLEVFCLLETMSLCSLLRASSSKPHCPTLPISGIIDKHHHVWFSPCWNLTGIWDHVVGDLYSGILIHGVLACLHKSLIRNVSLGTYMFPWRLQMKLFYRLQGPVDLNVTD